MKSCVKVQAREEMVEHSSTPWCSSDSGEEDEEVYK